MDVENPQMVTEATILSLSLYGMQQAWAKSWQLFFFFLSFILLYFLTQNSQK